MTGKSLVSTFRRIGWSARFAGGAEFIVARDGKGLADLAERLLAERVALIASRRPPALKALPRRRWRRRAAGSGGGPRAGAPSAKALGSGRRPIRSTPRDCTLCRGHQAPGAGPPHQATRLLPIWWRGGGRSWR